MTWYAYGGNRYWVGSHSGMGLLVFTEEALGESRQELQGYVARRREFVSFKKDVLRTRIQASGFSREEALEAIKASLGPASSTVSLRSRAAHCWACHLPLSTASEKSCAECNWIFCRCGACGCNRLT